MPDDKNNSQSQNNSEDQNQSKPEDLVEKKKIIDNELLDIEEEPFYKSLNHPSKKNS